MIENILDASAVLAVLQDEPGKDKVEAIFERSALGRVNATEVLTTLINKGSSFEDAVLALDSLELAIIEFDKAQAEKTAELRVATMHLGLSLGDRACLALAILQNVTAVTADQNWLKLHICPIESIR